MAVAASVCHARHAPAPAPAAAAGCRETPVSSHHLFVRGWERREVATGGARRLTLKLGMAAQIGRDWAGRGTMRRAAAPGRPDKRKRKRKERRGDRESRGSHWRWALVLLALVGVAGIGAIVGGGLHSSDTEPAERSPRPPVGISSAQAAQRGIFTTSQPLPELADSALSSPTLRGAASNAPAAAVGPQRGGGGSDSRSKASEPAPGAASAPLRSPQGDNTGRSVDGVDSGDTLAAVQPPHDRNDGGNQVPAGSAARASGSGVPHHPAPQQVTTGAGDVPQAASHDDLPEWINRDAAAAAAETQPVPEVYPDECPDIACPDSIRAAWRLPERGEIANFLYRRRQSISKRTVSQLPARRSICYKGFGTTTDPLGTSKYKQDEPGRGRHGYPEILSRRLAQDEGRYPSRGPARTGSDNQGIVRPAEVDGGGARLSPFSMPYEPALSHLSGLLPIEDFHSQEGEDMAVLFGLFRDQLDSYSRCERLRCDDAASFSYVEIGAFDGSSDSNTFLMGRRLGWRGLLVEPSPVRFDSIAHTRPDRDTYAANRAMCDHDAWATDRGTVRFRAHDLQGGIVKRDVVERLSSEALLSKVYTVKCGKMKDLEAKAGLTHIDFYSIDVEGAELDLLQSRDWEAVSVSVILIELNLGKGIGVQRCGADPVRRELASRGMCRLAGDVGHANEVWVNQAEFEAKGPPPWAGNPTPLDNSFVECLDRPIPFPIGVAGKRNEER